MLGGRTSHSVLPSAGDGHLHSTNSMTLTYEQLFKFMGTFSNQELDDAQVIAEYHSKESSKSYNQILVELLVEMRQAS